MSLTHCISFDAFFAIFERNLRRRYTIYFFIYFFYMSFQYIFSIELVGFCDAINNKGVKWGVRY